MDKIETLEKRVNHLSATIRGTLSVVVIILVFRTVQLLSKGKLYQKIFEDILKGQALPKLTEVLCSNGPLLSSIVIGFGAFSVSTAYRKKEECWPIFLLAACTVGLMLFKQVIFSASIQPIVQIIQNLGAY